MRNDQLKAIEEAVEANFDEEIRTLKELVAIKSVATNGAARADDKDRAADANGENMPFGQGVHRAFSYFLEKGREMGFTPENVDNYGGHLEFEGYTYDENGDIAATAQEVMGIVGHLDTVPEGSGWSHDPFACEIDGGRIYGRGVQDDKGPMVAALYAMKAVKDAGYRPETTVRLILGLDEETEWEGMERYNEQVDLPDFGFTPDADFPVISDEKGILIFKLAKKLGRPPEKGLRLRSVSGGSAPNMVPDYARAVILSANKEDYEPIKLKAARWREDGKGTVKTRVMGKSMEVTAEGVTAHGAKPEQGVNAISILMDFIGDMNFASDGASEFIEFYNKHIGKETDGASLGCALSDEVSGGTAVNAGMIEMDEKSASLTVNVRYPVSFKGEDVYGAIAPALSKYDIGVVKDSEQLPIHMDEDSRLVSTLMEAYREQTGDTKARPIVTGGGTYARAFHDFVAFGALYPDSEDRMHMPDENMTLDEFRRTTLIYADAILRLTVPEEQEPLKETEAAEKQEENEH